MIVFVMFAGLLHIWYVQFPVGSVSLVCFGTGYLLPAVGCCFPPLHFPLPSSLLSWIAWTACSLLIPPTPPPTIRPLPGQEHVSFDAFYVAASEILLGRGHGMGE